jgi:hypothetical protein
MLPCKITRQSKANFLKLFVQRIPVFRIFYRNMAEKFIFQRGNYEIGATQCALTTLRGKNTVTRKSGNEGKHAQFAHIHRFKAARMPHFPSEA